MGTFKLHIIAMKLLLVWFVAVLNGFHLNFMIFNYILLDSLFTYRFIHQMNRIQSRFLVENSIFFHHEYFT